MPVTYTNRRGHIYTLYQGLTKTGKPRYYFGRSSQIQGEPVPELPPGFTISESINGIVSLVKDRPSQIQPEEVAAVEAVLQQHPEARRYRVIVKHNYIEIYERIGIGTDALSEIFQAVGVPSAGLSEKLQAMEERQSQYLPVLRFTLLNAQQREFGVERMSYRGGMDRWINLWQTGPAATLAQKFIPTLGTDQFYELF